MSYLDTRIYDMDKTIEEKLNVDCEPSDRHKIFLNDTKTLIIEIKNENGGLTRKQLMRELMRLFGTLRTETVLTRCTLIRV